METKLARIKITATKYKSRKSLCTRRTQLAGLRGDGFPCLRASSNSLRRSDPNYAATSEPLRRRLGRKVSTLPSVEILSRRTQRVDVQTESSRAAACSRQGTRQQRVDEGQRSQRATDVRCCRRQPKLTM